MERPTPKPPITPFENDSEYKRLFGAKKPKKKKDTKGIIVPVSGGKDSAATLLLAIEEIGKEFVIPVFNDTGWEHPITYKYLEYLESHLGLKINRTIGGNRRDGTKARTLQELIKSQGRFPFGLGRFCTTYLKQYALRDWYKNNLYSPKDNYEIWFGMRTGESSQRARKYADVSPYELMDMGDLFPSRYPKKLRATLKVRLPIVDWYTDEVFEYLKDNGVKYNPLYDEGTNDRVGCYPCMLAGKKVQQRMLNTVFGQQRVQEIKDLELKIGQKYEMYDTDQGSCELCNI